MVEFHKIKKKTSHQEKEDLRLKYSTNERVTVYRSICMSENNSAAWLLFLQ